MNPINYEKQARIRKRRVFYTGDDAIAKGTGVCYESKHTGDGAGEPDERRDLYVGKPDSDNAARFAGVVLQSYEAKANGQWIEIAEPGSTALCLCAASTTVGETRLVAEYDGSTPGVFAARTADPDGERGAGTLLALQSVTISSGTDLVLAYLEAGQDSGLKNGA